MPRLTIDQLDYAIDVDPETKRLYAAHLTLTLSKPPQLTDAIARRVQPEHEKACDEAWNAVVEAAVKFYQEVGV